MKHSRITDHKTSSVAVAKVAFGLMVATVDAENAGLTEIVRMGNMDAIDRAAGLLR